MIEKLPILGINVDFVTVVFLHKARPCLPTVLQTWCQQGTVSEFSIWVMYLFTVSIEMRCCVRQIKLLLFIDTTLFLHFHS